MAARLVALANGPLGLEVERSLVTELGSAGAAVVSDGRAVFDPGSGTSGVGAAMAWAMRLGADDVHLVAEPRPGRDLGVWARQAEQFSPAPHVWSIETGGLVAVEPAPFPDIRVPPSQTAELTLLLEQAGLEVVVEHGVVLGELRGLEVARVVIGEAGRPELQVGVGRLDREAFALLHGDLTRPDALAQVVERIAPLRSPSAPPHPANRLARERWLRHQVLADPGLVGAASLEPAEGPEPRAGLRDVAIAVALGSRPDGSPVVVVTSDGVDLETVPRAGDARAWHAPDAELVVVVPSHNLHPATARLAARLARPAQVLDIAAEWPR